MDAAFVPGAVMVMSTALTAGDVRALLTAVRDPEIPVLTIEDMGILRDVTFEDDDTISVTITPTYSGCPAMEVIASDIVSTLAEQDLPARVVTQLSPAWTTDWMSAEGREKLAAFGIAPPARRANDPLHILEEIRCPNCGSSDVRVISEFGSTACKRMVVCQSCLEPFDHFKAI